MTSRCTHVHACAHARTEGPKVLVKHLSLGHNYVGHNYITEGTGEAPFTGAGKKRLAATANLPGMHTHTCMHARMHARMHAPTLVHVLPKHAYTSACTCRCARMFTRMHTQACACMCTCTCARTHKCPHAHACMHARTYLHMPPSVDVAAIGARCTRCTDRCCTDALTSALTAIPPLHRLRHSR